MTEVKSGNPKFQVLAAILANIPALTYGIQIGWLSPMSPILQSELTTPAPTPIVDADISWMATALPSTAVVGVPIFIYLSDKVGRKRCIILLSVLSALSWILKLWATNRIGLILARSLAGISSAGCFLVVPVYVREISEDSLRGILGSLLMTACNLGVIVVYTLGMFVTYYGNQSIYLTIALLHIALFIYMPESPAYLIKRGQEQEAIKAINWLRGLSTEDEEVINEIAKLKEDEETFKSMPQVSIISIIKDRPIFRALRICLVLIGVQTLSGCFAVVNYAGDIFRRSGTDLSPDVLALFVGALQLAGSLLATSLVEKSGRKVLLISSLAVVSLCMSSIATVFLLDHLQMSPSSWPALVAVCLCIFAYGAGLAPMPFVVMAEMFSFHLRARLSGAIMMFSWTNSTLTVLLFAPLANAFGEHVVFYAFAAVTMFGAIYTALCVPETKGRSLENIHKILENKKL